jgi:Major Facilitator Superfamily
MDSSPPAATISATASPGDRVPADSVGPAPVGARLPAHVVLLFAVACGLSVATIYFAHPLLDEIARDLAIEPAVVGFAVTATQIGYGLGLVFLVPLGDILERRRLVALQMALCAVALACAGLARTSFSLLAALFCVGILAVVIQTLVALTASLAPDAQRGRAVGLVTSGVVVGILLARFVSGTLADLGGWRLVYLCAAPLMLLVTALLFATTPSQRAADRVSYAALLGSLGGLLRDEPLLRARAAQHPLGAARAAVVGGTLHPLPHTDRAVRLGRRRRRARGEPGRHARRPRARSAHDGPRAARARLLVGAHRAPPILALGADGGHHRARPCDPGGSRDQPDADLRPETGGAQPARCGLHGVLCGRQCGRRHLGNPRLCSC